jgi:hypothetical protein
VHSRVWWLSATTLLDCRARPVRRCAQGQERHGEQGGDGERDADRRGVRLGTDHQGADDSTPTYAARAKKDHAISRTASCSRLSGIRCRNCHRMISPEDTSMPESRPKPTRATEPATSPAASAITPSVAL